MQLKRLVFVAWAMLAGGIALAADPPDLPGAKDIPLISRYAGSSLVAYADISYEEASLPLTSEVDDKHYLKSQTIEGRITQRAYLAPAGRTALEVTRNYQQALVKAGLQLKFACEKEKCGPNRIQEPLIAYAQGMKQMESYGGYSGMAMMVLNTSDPPYFFWGTLDVDGRSVYVMVLTSNIDASEGSALKGRAGTFIEVVEPKAMESDKVSVDASAIRNAVKSAGKIALYGIYFDTGKADIKPESKAQLLEIGKFLNEDKSVKVIVVGHTDNVGNIESNQTLSQQRASAVAAALAKDYQVAPARIIAKGVANFSPVASNFSEAGRAKNRRVELVQQ